MKNITKMSVIALGLVMGIGVASVAHAEGGFVKAPASKAGIAYGKKADLAYDLSKVEIAYSKAAPQMIAYAKEIAYKVDNDQELSPDELAYLAYVAYAQRLADLEKAVKEIGFTVKDLAYEPKPQY